MGDNLITPRGGPEATGPFQPSSAEEDVASSANTGEVDAPPPNKRQRVDDEENDVVDGGVSGVSGVSGEGSPTAHSSTADNEAPAEGLSAEHAAPMATDTPAAPASDAEGEHHENSSGDAHEHEDDEGEDEQEEDVQSGEMDEEEQEDTATPAPSASDPPAELTSSPRSKQRAAAAMAMAAMLYQRMREETESEIEAEARRNSVRENAGSAAAAVRDTAQSGKRKRGSSGTSIASPLPSMSSQRPAQRQAPRPKPTLHLLKQFERHELRDCGQWSDHLWRARRGGFQGVRAPLIAEFATNAQAFRSLLEAYVGDASSLFFYETARRILNGVHSTLVARTCGCTCFSQRV